MLCCKCFCFPAMAAFDSTVKPSSEGQSGGTTAVVAAVVTVIAVVAALTGLFVCQRRFRQQRQSRVGGLPENVSLYTN